ncbi:MAG TPA: V-type ATP synthase subunit E family protein [Phycisphaerae bacterium]|nr:V-type ATP synthase subunit E family protein [Phycisphaerae bacterium]HUX15068.1 V-type ATP synthase subunit E family protein [Phycisphaerae bacterium]
MTPDEPNPQDVLREEILADARRQAERTVRRAERDAEDGLQKARKEADADHASRLDAARREAERRHNLVLAAIPVEEARMRAQRVEEALEAIRDEARRKLAERGPSGAGGEEYRRTLVRLAAEAVSNMAGERFVLELGAEDLKAVGNGLADDVRKAVGRQGLQIAVAPEPADIEAGIIVRDDDGRQVVDNSLAARLERLWPALRLAVGARLVPDEPEKKDKEP